MLHVKSPFPYLAVLLLAGLVTIHAADPTPRPATTNPAAIPEAKKAQPDFDNMDADAHVAYFIPNHHIYR